MKLRGWVKVVLVILVGIGIVNYANYVKESYNQCMEHTNGNANICSSLKN